MATASDDACSAVPSASPREREWDMSLPAEIDNPASNNDTDTVKDPNATPRTPRGSAAGERIFQAAHRAMFGQSHGGSDTEWEDDYRHRMRWFGLLHPDTPIRAAYDMFQLLIMINLAWVLPYRFAFSKKPETTFDVVIDILIDLSVWIDIFLQMKMYTFDNMSGKLVTDGGKNKRKYLKSWFLIDFLSVVPLDQVLLAIGSYMISSDSSDGRAAGESILEWSIEARLLRLLRLVRLAKIGSLLRIDEVVHALHSVLKNLGASKLQVAFYFRMIFLVCLMLFATHFLGCYWLYLGRWNVLQVDIPTGWMNGAYGQDTGNHTRDFISCRSAGFDIEAWNALHGSSCTKGRFGCDPIPAGNPYDVDCSWILDGARHEGHAGDANGVGVDESKQYLTAFYFCLVTITTVGFGDLLPNTAEEKQFVSFAILVGCFLYAYIIGDFSTLLSGISAERSEFDSHLRDVANLLQHISAPPELRSKVRSRAHKFLPAARIPMHTQTHTSSYIHVCSDLLIVALCAYTLN